MNKKTAKITIFCVITLIVAFLIALCLSGEWGNLYEIFMRDTYVLTNENISYYCIPIFLSFGFGVIVLWTMGLSNKKQKDKIQLLKIALCATILFIPLMGGALYLWNAVGGAAFFFIALLYSNAVALGSAIAYPLYSFRE